MMQYKIILLFAVKLQNRMFKRLFSTSEIEKTFTDCRIDKSHNYVIFKRLNVLLKSYFSNEQVPSNVNISINIANNQPNNININIQNNSKSKPTHNKRKQFTNFLLKKINSTCDTLKIKSLITAHHVIRKTRDQQFINSISQELDPYIVSSTEIQDKKTQIKIENTKDSFMQKNIISFYCKYLKKFILNMQTFAIASKFMDISDKAFENLSKIELINQGFIVLNLINFMIQSQQTFNKMGRYYKQHEQIISLFVMYLNDLLVWNGFIKGVTQIASKAIKEGKLDKLQVNHYFLFITQAQKSSDRLYEFFYNRYYYYKVKEMLLMPTFLTIENGEFTALVAHVKKVDRNLVHLVRKSKYDNHSNMESRLNKTEMSLDTTKSYELNKTFGGERRGKGEDVLDNIALYIDEKVNYRDMEDFTHSLNE